MQVKFLNHIVELTAWRNRLKSQSIVGGMKGHPNENFYY